jgi:hypothetical protein
MSDLKARIEALHTIKVDDEGTVVEFHHNELFEGEYVRLSDVLAALVGEEPPADQETAATTITSKTWPGYVSDEDDETEDGFLCSEHGWTPHVRCSTCAAAKALAASPRVGSEPSQTKQSSTDLKGVMPSEMHVRNLHRTQLPDSSVDPDVTGAQHPVENTALAEPSQTKTETPNGD